MRFTDERLYVLGIGEAYMVEPGTGNILYWTNKMREADVSFSATDNVLSAGIGNGPAIIIPTDPNITVNVTAADYSEYVKAASVGGVIAPGAPVLTCQQVTAEGPTLTISTASGTPVAGAGMDKIVCYVQEVGAASPVSAGGIAYELDPQTGSVSGFTAVSERDYLVTYHVAKANATMTTVMGNLKGKIVHFVFSQPIYTNYDAGTMTGDFYGWLHTIIPRLQLLPGGGSSAGSQTDFTMTGITGRAITADPLVVTEDCGGCGYVGAPMAYRIVEPCEAVAAVEGIIGIVGGSVLLKVGESVQLRPALVQSNTLITGLPPSDFQYSSSNLEVAQVGYNSGALIGSGEGTAKVAVFYTVPKTGERLTDIFRAIVTKSGVINDTRLYLSVSRGRTITLCYTQSTENAVLVDWGDASGTESSESLAATMTHTYTDGGSPILSLHVQNAGQTWSPGKTENGNALNILGAAPGAYVSGITSVSFGTGARLANAGGFRGITSLAGIVFSESDMSSIGTSSFQDCANLSTVDLTGIKEIGQSAFEGCGSLAGLSIPASVAIVKSYAFRYAGLVNLQLAAEAIEGEAFANCSKLQNVWIRQNVTNLGNDAGVVTDYPWNECNKSAVLYCEESAKPETWGYEYNVYGFASEARTRLTTVWGQTESPFVPAWGAENTGSLAYTWNYETLTIDISVQNLEDEYQTFRFSDTLMTLDVQDISADYYVAFYDEIGTLLHGENVEPGQSVTTVPAEYSEWEDGSGRICSSADILNMAVETDTNWVGRSAGE